MSAERGEHTVSLERLAEALAAVQRQCPELAVLAIPWMHLKHPVHPVQEALLRGEGRGDGRLRRLVASLLYAGYYWGRLLGVHLRMRHELAALKRQSFDFIAKSWSFGVGRSDREADFHYGDLQRRLGQRGVRVLLVYGNVWREGWTAFAKGCARAPLPRLSEMCLVPLAAPLRMLARQWRASSRLRRLAAMTEDPLVKRISLLASRDCLAPQTARGGVYFWIGQALVRAWRPRAVLTLYESHGWEQALRWGIKTADPSCRTIGYQHVFIFPEARSMTRPPRPAGLPVHPDLVLCVGEVSRERLRAGHEPYGTRLVRFGSFWHRPPAVARPVEASRRAILVVPESSPAESQALFRFADACARRLSSYTFILRCHPEFPMSRALRLVSADLPRLPNVVLSERKVIEEDCARSSAVLYRGSSAVVYAILQGLLPIYVQLDRDDRDPLDGLPAWRVRCETPDGLAEILARHERAPTDRLEAAWQAAVRYLDECTGPVTDESIEALMEGAGLTELATVEGSPVR